MAALEGLQKRITQELEKYKTIQKDFQKTYSLRQQLDAQLNENNVVKEEMELLESDSNVYKLTGPILIKQDLDEAKQNVSKRIEYITSELKRHDSTLQELEKKQDNQREVINKLQQQFQQAQVKAAMKA
ncbi:prefoldin subunit 6 [Centruroides vittatus]|uniref:prefoldin subunit 6-like n=1 Tax=Centruroides sculpturatus TaxID=218467 RepID=UPI000C6DF806|nr:prefoldin subunit 6-like [Centruroides sculpturatus]